MTTQRRSASAALALVAGLAVSAALSCGLLSLPAFAPAHGPRCWSHQRWRSAAACHPAPRAGRCCSKAADGETPSVAESLGAQLPFVTDAAFIGEDVVYEGPLVTVRGRVAYLEHMRAWRQNLPERLNGFSITALDCSSVQPGQLTCRWSCGFLAPLPPTARFRGLPEGMAVLPDERVAVETKLRVVLTLDGDGRVVRHEEEISAGFGVPDAIARYELLTARRMDSDNPVAWYWRVLRETTLEELDFYSGGRAERSELEWRFNEMVLRNFGYGAVIGAAIYAALKVLVTQP